MSPAAADVKTDARPTQGNSKVVWLSSAAYCIFDNTRSDASDAMISKKCKYALKALVRLGQEYGGRLVLADEIAKSENIPKKFLEQILLDLKRAGYVRSKQGSKGGYRLVQAPSQITLAEIHRLFDGAIAMLPCVSQKFYEACDDCPDEEACRLKRVFVDIREKTFDLLSGITIESFLNEDQSVKKIANQRR